MKKYLLAVGLSLCAVGSASAAANAPYMSTEQMVKACQSGAMAFCDGYAQGVYDMYLASRHPSKNPPFLCMPSPGPSRASVIKGFVAWAGQNPQYAQLPAADSMMRYMAGVFPCKK